MIEFDASGLDSASLRSAGKELLSLALIEARNHTLRWASALEAAAGGAALALPADLPAPLVAELDPVLWTLGHIGWFQEYWIARNVQRARGEHADPTHPRLASIVPEADAWYDPATIDRSHRRELATGALPDLPTTRAYLVETLETTLELLAGIATEDDASLYFHRLALFHEEIHGEAFAVLAQTLGIDDKAGLVARITTRPARPPLYLPATRWLLGSSGAGFRFDNEAEPHPVDVPEFEIDAQAVTWAQYGEFVEDGGYDERAHWSLDGWDWLQREGRRTPRHVDQMRHGVLQRRFGVLARVAAAHPAVHVSWHEADAWCRWAGRRLPTEVEWELAAGRGRSRGFVWGEVPEWVAGHARPWPGGVALDRTLRAQRVQRGCAWFEPRRLAHPKARRFMAAERDEGFAGFRSCAI